MKHKYEQTSMVALIDQSREFESALIAEAMSAMGCPNPESY